MSSPTMRSTPILSSRWKRWSVSTCSPTPSSSTCITASDAKSDSEFTIDMGRSPASDRPTLARPAEPCSRIPPKRRRGGSRQAPPKLAARLHQTEQRVERAPSNDGVNPGFLVAVPLVDHRRQPEDHEATERKRNENGDRGKQPERCVRAALADIDQKHLAAPCSHDDSGPDRCRSHRHQEGVPDYHSSKIPPLLTRILGAGGERNEKGKRLSAS